MKKMLLTSSLILLTISLIIPFGSANNLYLDTQEFILVGTDGYYFETNLYPLASKQILIAFTPKPDFQQITDTWIHLQMSSYKIYGDEPSSVTINFKINSTTFLTKTFDEDDNSNIFDIQLTESELSAINQAIQTGVNVFELYFDSYSNVDFVRFNRLRLYITYEYRIPEVEQLETIAGEEQSQSGFLQTITNLIQDFLDRFPRSAAVAGVLAPVNKIIIIGPLLILVGIAVISSIFAMKKKRIKRKQNQ